MNKRTRLLLLVLALFLLGSGQVDGQSADLSFRLDTLCNVDKSRKECIRVFDVNIL